MNILIKGADISPDHIQGITVFPEGFAVVEEYDMLLPIKTTRCEVASVPTPHGRLIDADELPVRDNYIIDDMPQDIVFSRDIDEAPTVIEAEE